MNCDKCDKPVSKPSYETTLDVPGVTKLVKRLCVPCWDDLHGIKPVKLAKPVKPVDAVIEDEE